MSYIDTYKDISISSEVMGASQKKQVMLLFEKLHQNIVISSAAINNQNTVLKCKKLANADHILEYIIESFDFESNKQLGQTLKGIFNHLQKLLFWANAKNDLQKLDEAKFISENLITWWKNAIS